MTDVVVVGGGPAGSATALLLARAGLAVHLVERARFPRRKVCGEYLNGGAVATLGRLGLLDAVRAIASPLRGVRLVAAGAPAVILPFSQPALACAREDLDALLLDAAIAAGVQVERGRVEDVMMDNGRCCGVVIRDDAGERCERRAQIVIGADGAGSVVARKLGLAKTPRGGRYAVGGHYAGFGALDALVEMYAGDGAYFALNPIGAARTNVMVVVPRDRLAQWSADVDAGVGGVAQHLGRGVRSFADATRIGARVSVGPLTHDVREPCASGAILVGDAAGFLDPFTGQGVFLALTGAEHAAAAVLSILRNGVAEAAAWRTYARWRVDDLKWRKRLGRVVAIMIGAPALARRAAHRLARHPDLASTLIDALGGAIAPRRALRFSVLCRLLV